MRPLPSRPLPSKLVLATHNDGKLAEMRHLLALTPRGRDVELVSAGALGLPVPAEEGDTFEANAFAKAHAAAEATGEVALSDDSGLCVAALDGDPGIRTADWAETPAGRDFALAMQRVEDALAERGATDRSAFFCAVLCLCWPDGTAEHYRGEAHGELVWPPRGRDGFGYDPVFRPAGHERTFGEMTAEEKHSWRPGEEGLSHRARAFAKRAAARLS